MKETKTSTYLIILSVMLMVAVLSMAFLMNHVYRSLYNDAYIINHTGIVRGSIQRYAKLNLDTCAWECKHLETVIDNEISLIKSHVLGTGDPIDETFIRRLEKLEQEWSQLKQAGELLIPDREQNRVEAFISLSELCWETADSAVLLAELSSSNKLSRINTYYIILGLTLLGFVIIIGLIYFSVRKSLEKEVSIDHLTRLNNLKSFHNDLDREMERCNRYGDTFSLTLFDIDNFKIINDESGHNAGDKALIEVSALIKSSLRASDNVYRIGGDEFAIIFPHTRMNKAHEISEKLRKKVEGIKFFSSSSISISVGISEYSKGIKKTELLHSADRALYQAKEKGKNVTISLASQSAT